MLGRGKRQKHPQSSRKVDALQPPAQPVPTTFNINKYVEEMVIQVDISCHPLANHTHNPSQRTIPTAADLHRRTVLLQKLSALVANGLASHHGLGLLPFGSCVLGLDTPSSDVDLTINGTLRIGTSNTGAPVICEARNLDPRERVRLLRALRGRVKRAPDLKELGFVPRARVPVFKFTYQEHPDLPPLLCDVSVANVDGVWKSTVLGYLLQMDRRASRLARLVKLWAKWQGINDPTAGTFNSYSLLLMVVWQLQNTPDHPILPPINALLNMDVDAKRPMDDNAVPPPELQEETRTRALTYKGYGSQCQLNVWQLFGCFLHTYWSMATLWATHEHGDRLRVCTWDAILDGQRWSTNCYCAGVEDPFNSDDNAARTMSDVRKVVNAFQSSRHAYYAASISGMESAAMFRLFGPAAVEDPELAALSAQLQDDIMAIKAMGMLPLVREAIEDEYRGQLLWVGPVRRIHRVVQKRLHGKVEKDVDEEVEVAMELESVTASIGELQLTTTTTTT